MKFWLTDMCSLCWTLPFLKREASIATAFDLTPWKGTFSKLLLLLSFLLFNNCLVAVFCIIDYYLSDSALKREVLFEKCDEVRD